MFGDFSALCAPTLCRCSSRLVLPSGNPRQSQFCPSLAWFDVEDRGATPPVVAATWSRGRPLRARLSGLRDRPSSSLVSTAVTQRSILIAGHDSSSNVSGNTSLSSSVLGVGSGEPIPRFRRSSTSRNMRADTLPLLLVDLDADGHAAARCFGLTPAVDDVVFGDVDDAAVGRNSSFDGCRLDAIHRPVYNVSPCWQPYTQT